MSSEGTTRELSADISLVPASESQNSYEDSQSLLKEVQAVIEYTRDWQEPVHAPENFVIGEDDDAASETSSDWHDVS
jgi:hypothetical protein